MPSGLYLQIIKFAQFLVRQFLVRHFLLPSVVFFSSPLFVVSYFALQSPILLVVRWSGQFSDPARRPRLVTILLFLDAPARCGGSPFAVVVFKGFSNFYFNSLRVCSSICCIIGGFLSRRKDYAQRYVKGIQYSVQQPPPAWPGTAVTEPGCRTWDGPKPISIVGSTGSIGTQTLDIVAENPDKFRVVALVAGSNVALPEQVKTFKPHLVAVRNESLISELKEALSDCDYKPEIIPGEEGVIEVARHPEAVTVVTGIVGCVGLKPTVAAIEAGIDITLANKETLIVGGPFVLPLAHKHKVKILPADSEHSAIFQCIHGLPEGALRRIILTASSGAFSFAS